MMTIDDFGEFMDALLKVSNVQMLITLPEGTIEPEIKDNIGLGPTVHFYILMHTCRAVFQEFREILNPDLEEDFIDSVLEMVKEDILADREDE